MLPHFFGWETDGRLFIRDRQKRCLPKCRTKVCESGTLSPTPETGVLPGRETGCSGHLTNFDQENGRGGQTSVACWTATPCDRSGPPVQSGYADSQRDG